ncbi:MAG: hypothetical protein LM550_11235 [Candidatus Contendobacter sp.]|jgi:hypothetical protein|nr:hypothetical protein [Gammaproteobacteria bacterium]MCC8994237.1 hypothetical protein [Candidatus Contendobacter sp.]
MNSSAPVPDLSAAIAAALARLPVGLADDRTRHSLEAIARRLPQALATGPLGLEIRLAGPTAVDFFAAAIPGDPGFAALIAVLCNPDRQAGWADPVRARDLAAVLERWQRREGSLPRVARYLLIEVDAPADPAGPVAAPGIFLAPRGTRDLPRPGQLPNAFHRFVEATVMATAELSGVWPDPATATALARVVETIPDDGDLFAVGAMVSRAAGSAMRIAIRRLEPESIHTVLRAAGYPRQADLLAEWAATTPANKQALHFEIGPGAESRVGLELSPAHDWKQARMQGWPELLDHLISRSVADPDRAAVVTGLIDPVGNPLWGLAHVKVAADESGMLPVAKLYVGLLHRSGEI